MHKLTFCRFGSFRKIDKNQIITNYKYFFNGYPSSGYSVYSQGHELIKN